MSSIMSEGYIMNFNQDFTSISVLSKNGYRLFTLNASDKVDEVYARENTEQIRIIERLFSSSLVVLVTQKKPNSLSMLHFKKDQEICNCVYPSDVLCVRMNRYRLVVCLAESIHIHDIRDMKILHSIDNIAPNKNGLCSLSMNSQLAFPICSTTGELRIFNANKVKPGLRIKAHDTALSALSFSSNGTMLATASERGTVIRVFCVKNGQRVQEFRRGVKRCVRIASLVFSTTADFLCASSNTETVHIFKIDTNALEVAERKSSIVSEDPTASPLTSAPKEDVSNNVSKTNNFSASTNKNETPLNNPSINQQPACTTSNDSWSMSSYFSSYLIPSQLGDVLAQDRAFATAVLSQPGLKYVCGLTRIQNELRLLMACEDGFLYVYDFNSEKGGPCKLLHVHDLRYALEGVVELNISDSMDKISLGNDLPSTPTTNPSCGFSVDKIVHTLASVSSSSSSSSPLNKSGKSDKSYAGILKGSDQTVNTMTDSAKFRKLCDAIDTPIKLYDERQFPPVAIAAKD